MDSVQITGKDEINSPIEFKASVSADNYAHSNGDFIYITPQIIHRSDENPLKTNIRRFPIDYGYRSNYTILTNLYIPEGYEIKEMPKDLTYSAAVGGVTYSRKISVTENQIQFLTKYTVKSIEVKAQFYNALREFYSKMIAAEAEQIVLQKKNTSETAVQTSAVK